MTCVSSTQLRQYALGDCDDSDREQIEWHLAECSQCEETFVALDDTADSLVRHLPLLAGEGEKDDSAVVPFWLDQLRSAPPNVHAGDRRSDAAEAEVIRNAPIEDSVLANYELLGVVGRGGMGIVYQARHRQLDRTVALKVLDPRLMMAPDSCQRFDREIRILGSLHHPGIVMAMDAGWIGSAAYVVMELIDGVDLNRLVREGGPLSAADACDAGRQIAEALAAAHQAGVIHRDLKPSNVMVDREGQIKLLDFGLSRFARDDDECSDTSLGQLLGTLAYMAPEQLTCHDAVHQRADMYGLGGCLFYLLTGRPPRDPTRARSLVARLQAVTNEPPPTIHTCRQDLPEGMANLIDRLLHDDPAQRPDSAEEVAEELAGWAGRNLAVRAREVVNSTQPIDAHNREVAEQSLARLLDTSPTADLSAREPSTASSVAATTLEDQATQESLRPNRTIFGGKGIWLGSLTAAVAATWFAVTILLETPTGTLRIESDVDNIQVELVDEQHRVRELAIDRNAQDTQLRTGRYRIRFAAPYDQLEILPSVITLEEGGHQVARIVQLSTAPREGDPSADPTTGGPVYQGEPAAVWQQRFESERSPLAKLKAAEALITLASELPAPQRIDQLVQVGAELLELGWGADQPWEPALQYLGRAKPGVPPKWATSDEARKAYNDLLSDLRRDVERMPQPTTSERLARLLIEGDEQSAALAAWTLAGISIYPHEPPDPMTVHRIVAILDGPLTDWDRTSVATLLMASLHDRAEQARILADLSGEDKEQDERIAQILDEPHPARLFARHLRDLLGQQTALVPIAQDYLRDISESALHPELREAADKFHWSPPHPKQ